MKKLISLFLLTVLCSMPIVGMEEKITIPTQKKTLPDKDQKKINGLLFGAIKQIKDVITFDRDEVIKLLEDGANPDTHDYNGMSLLHYACVYDSLPLAKLLIEYEANINLQDDTGRTPLMLACLKDNISIATFLISKGAKVNICSLKQQAFLGAASDGEFSALYKSCENGNLPLIKLLLSAGADAQSPTTHNNTPMHAACSIGNLKSVLYLLNSVITPSVNWDNTKLILAGHLINEDSPLRTLPLELIACILSFCSNQKKNIKRIKELILHKNKDSQMPLDSFNHSLSNFPTEMLPILGSCKFSIPMLQLLNSSAWDDENANESYKTLMGILKDFAKECKEDELKKPEVKTSKMEEIE